MPGHDLPSAADFPWGLETRGEAGTEDLGRRLGERLRGGEILLLYGELGAGKTCLVRGLCRGMGIEGEVVSPTFTLVNTYPGRLTVHHLDFYRIDRDASLEDIGIMEILDEVTDGRAVLAVEWPDPLLPELAGLAAPLTLLGLADDGPDGRCWRMRWDDPAAAGLAAALGFTLREDGAC